MMPGVDHVGGAENLDSARNHGRVLDVGHEGRSRSGVCRLKLSNFIDSNHIFKS